MMTKHKGTRKFAVWTPMLSEVNGQNIVTNRVRENQRDLIGDVYQYRGGLLAKIPQTLWYAAQLFFKGAFGKYGGIYVVASRSSVGFIRDFLPLLASRFGVRTVVHIHGSDFPALLEKPFFGPVARWLYSQCEIIVPSTHLIESLARHRFQSLHLCENFSSFEFEIEALISGDKSDDLHVLWNSNVMSSKGIIELVDGLKLLRKEGAKVKLIVLGKPLSDNERREVHMMRFLEEISREGWIRVKGQIPAASVSNLVATSDVVALPSTYSSECQPLAVIQGMLSGRAILVSETAAMRATVGDYPAAFVKRDASSIAHALRPLATKARDYKRETDHKRAAERSRERFSPEKFDKTMRQIFLKWEQSQIN